MGLPVFAVMARLLRRLCRRPRPAQPPAQAQQGPVPVVEDVIDAVTDVLYDGTWFAQQVLETTRRLRLPWLRQRHPGSWFAAPGGDAAVEDTVVFDAVGLPGFLRQSAGAARGGAGTSLPGAPL